MYNTRKCDYPALKVEKLVIFYLVGNKGDVQQFQPIANSMFEYTQKVEKYQKRHTCVDQYFFNLQGEPTAFSLELIKEQADYVTSKIKELVLERDYDQFNIVAHSVGGYVANIAMEDIRFPRDKLRNMINLASPLLKPPQVLTHDLTVALKLIKNQDFYGKGVPRIDNVS